MVSFPPIVLYSNYNKPKNKINNNNNNNAILINSYGSLQDLILLFKIPMGMCKDALEMYTKFRHTLKMFRLPSYRGCDNDWGGEQCGAEGDREQVK